MGIAWHMLLLCIFYVLIVSIILLFYYLLRFIYCFGYKSCYWVHWTCSNLNIYNIILSGQHKLVKSFMLMLIIHSYDQIVFHVHF